MEIQSLTKIIQSLQEVLPADATLVVSRPVVDLDEAFHVVLGGVAFKLHYRGVMESLAYVLSSILRFDENHGKFQSDEALHFDTCRLVPNDWLYELLENLQRASCCLWIAKDEFYVFVYDYGFVYPLENVTPAELIDWCNDVANGSW